METFNETGPVDYLDLLSDLDDAYTTLEQNAGTILSEGLLDYSVRAGLSLAGWKPVSSCASLPDVSQAVFVSWSV